MWGIYFVQLISRKALGGCFLNKASACPISEILAGTYTNSRHVMIKSPNNMTISNLWSFICDLKEMKPEALLWFMNTKSSSLRSSCSVLRGRRDVVLGLCCPSPFDNKKASGAAMIGMVVIMTEVTRQSVCSNFVGKIKFHPMQWIPPKVMPKNANTVTRE